MKLISIKHVPNIISAIRLLLVMPVMWLIGSGYYASALLLFMIAAVSDGVDGYIARRYNCGSHLGGWLDPVADKLMQTGAFFMLTWTGLLPWWLFTVVVSRDAVIVAGGLGYYYFVERVDAQPSLISKLNTVVQMLLIVVVLSGTLYTLPTVLTIGMMAAVVITTAWSGVHYLVVWSRRA